MTTIRVELIGGLGNQMFQAAAGRAVSERLGARLELDISRIGGSRGRHFALDVLPHGATVVRDERRTAVRKSEMLAYRIGSAVLPSVRRPVNGWSGPVYVEPHFHFDPSIRALSGNCYLRGYFQSPKYFEDIEPTIRGMFDLVGCVSEMALQTVARYATSDVAVHIRRGDFASDSRANQVHGLLDGNYYQTALAFLEERGSIGAIHVFTDDQDYAKSILPTDSRLVFQRGLTEHDDMYMMSRAQRHIIANSTFSWWSAWLDPRPDARIVAPKAWFSERTLGRTSLKDLFPPGWVVL